jgi:hypothetical protein
VVHFVTLEGLTPGDIHAELVSVYGADVLVLHTLYKWHKRFAQGKTEFFNDPRSGRLLQNDLAEAVRTMLQECHFTSCKRPCAHFRLAKAMYLGILHNVFVLKSSIYAGFGILSTAIKTPNELHFRRNYSKF